MTSKQLSVAEVQTLFRLRSRTVNVKDNQKSSFKDIPWCRTCLLFNEAVLLLSLKSEVGAAVSMENRSRLGVRVEEIGAK